MSAARGQVQAVAARRGLSGRAGAGRHGAASFGAVSDLADPVAFIRGETDPELARFWPYVFGATGPMDPDVTARYSRLMTDSQGIVAQDALRMVDLRGVQQLLDIGGGTGAFLRAVRARYPELRLSLFDLPDVVAQAACPPMWRAMAGRSAPIRCPKGPMRSALSACSMTMPMHRSPPCWQRSMRRCRPVGACW